jgi:hypothetical protein
MVYEMILRLVNEVSANFPTMIAIIAAVLMVKFGTLLNIPILIILWKYRSQYLFVIYQVSVVIKFGFCLYRNYKKKVDLTISEEMVKDYQDVVLQQKRDHGDVSKINLDKANAASNFDRNLKRSMVTMIPDMIRLFPSIWFFVIWNNTAEYAFWSILIELYLCHQYKWHQIGWYTLEALADPEPWHTKLYNWYYRCCPVAPDGVENNFRPRNVQGVGFTAVPPPDFVSGGTLEATNIHEKIVRDIVTGDVLTKEELLIKFIESLMDLGYEIEFDHVLEAVKGKNKHRAQTSRTVSRKKHHGIKDYDMPLELNQLSLGKLKNVHQGISKLRAYYENNYQMAVIGEDDEAISFANQKLHDLELYQEQVYEWKMKQDRDTQIRLNEQKIREREQSLYLREHPDYTDDSWADQAELDYTSEALACATENVCKPVPKNPALRKQEPSVVLLTNEATQWLSEKMANPIVQEALVNGNSINMAKWNELLIKVIREEKVVGYCILVQAGLVLMDHVKDAGMEENALGTCVLTLEQGDKRVEVVLARSCFSKDICGDTLRIYPVAQTSFKQVKKANVAEFIDNVVVNVSAQNKFASGAARVDGIHLLYLVDTEAGFSGSLIYQNNKAVAMHQGSAGNYNFGVYFSKELQNEFFRGPTVQVVAPSSVKYEACGSHRAPRRALRSVSRN